MHVIVWQFTVREEYVEEFVSAYGADGDWEKLFRHSQGYLRTELLRSLDDPRVFLTIDRWDDPTSFETFKAQFAEEYKRLDERFELYTSEEQKIGVFSETETGA
jgi:heme-degrading monooxygenase HmoA